MLPSTGAFLLAGAVFVEAQTLLDPALTGTWTSKSNKTLTGPAFYNPVKDELIEPSHPGISYSFTQDGFYEEAYYRAIANPVDPSCPKGLMQWQHGSYQKFPNGSLILTPIAVDGRQLWSDPCGYDSAIYTRYNQTELIQHYEIITDPYHNIQRLNLYKFDGAPVMPLYLALDPPQMLPTTTLKPITSTSVPGGHKATGSTQKLKRALGLSGKGKRTTPEALTKRSEWYDPDRWLYFGIGTIALGSLLQFCF